jgi:hypothetical protein
MNLLGARYYDSSVGRFLSADPIGLGGGINQFAYCDNDPVNLVDPYGLDPYFIFTWEGTGEGLATGGAAVGSSFTFGLWDGGTYKNKPGFGVSRVCADVGRDALITAGTLGAGNAISEARYTRVLTRIATKSNEAIPGIGGRIGTLRHARAVRVLERFQRTTGKLRDLSPETSFKFGSQIGGKGSVRFDVLRNGTWWRRPSAWDYKFGTARLTASREAQLIEHGPQGLRSVIEVKP